MCSYYIGVYYLSIHLFTFFATKNPNGFIYNMFIYTVVDVYFFYTLVIYYIYDRKENTAEQNKT